MDHELSDTLGELERKLHELERTLTAMGQGEERAGQGASAPAADSAAATDVAWHERGADEADSAAATDVAWHERSTDEADSAEEAGSADGADGAEQDLTVSEGRLIDEAVERRDPRDPVGAWDQTVDSGQPARIAQPSSPAAEAGAVEPAVRAVRPPAPPPTPAELLHFRERLERTASELTGDYDDLLARLRYTPVSAPSGPAISFARGAPSLDIVDVEGLQEAAIRAFENDPGGATAYGTSVGYLPLRAWIADRHGVEPERVLVTNGSMQADAFLFDHLVRPRDEVIVERPTYDRTLLALQQRGARLRPVKLQPDGIDTEALARLLTGGAGARPKLAHIIPNFQNPAGYTLSLARREALLALSARYGFLIFEDDPYVALRFTGESLPTMLSMDPDRVVYASSFSKTVCPGIRVGYLVGPPTVIDAIAQLATNTYIAPNMVAQAIVYEFCVSGTVERSIETVRTALAERAACLAVALRRELPDAEFVAPEGGYFMWVTLPAGTDVQSLHSAASELGVTFVKGTDFVLKRGENTLRLAYAGVTPEQIDEGVARLAAAYRSLG